MPGYRVENRQALQGRAGTTEGYHSKGERMKSHVEGVRKQVEPAEMQLEYRVEEQLFIQPSSEARLGDMRVCR